jgi:Phytanoyl-CoA dioxygenase (PhyH)
VNLELARDGALRVPSAIDLNDWSSFLAQPTTSQAGVRLRGLPFLHEGLGQGSVPLALAQEISGKAARPVRAILFNKTAANNWPLGWHQDRTIAVAERHNVSGFGPWTIKQGIAHVEPPFEFIAKMITLRLHFDDVDEDNAPLRVARGSHTRGLIPESDYDDVVGQSNELECHAKVGDIWAYSTPILHASSSARSPTNRRVLHVDYSGACLPTPLEWAGI